MKEKYRIIVRTGIFYLQFQDTINILGFKFKVWRYIPTWHGQGIFKRKRCDLTMGFGLFHMASVNKPELTAWAKDNPTLDNHFQSLKDKRNLYTKTTYL